MDITSLQAQEVSIALKWYNAFLKPIQMGIFLLLNNVFKKFRNFGICLKKSIVLLHNKGVKNEHFSLCIAGA